MCEGSGTPELPHPCADLVSSDVTRGQLIWQHVHEEQTRCKCLEPALQYSRLLGVLLLCSARLSKGASERMQSCFESGDVGLGRTAPHCARA